jgi:hypothetical protein
MSAKFVAIGSIPLAAPKRGPKAHHRRTARHALALIPSGGIVLLASRRESDGTHGHNVAVAANEMVRAAERRHRKFWEAFDAASSLSGRSAA